MRDLNRNAFTIIEVMVAVLIISFVGWGLLQMQQNTLHNITVVEDNFNTACVVSPLLLQADKKNHNKSKDLYSFIKDRYNIKYDPMISEMKKAKISYWHKDFAFISLEEGEENIKEAGIPTPKLGLSIQKVIVKEGKGSATLYSFEVVQ